MSHGLSVHRIALSLMATNLAIGLVPFGLLAVLHPAIALNGTIPIWLCLILALATAGAVSSAPDACEEGALPIRPAGFHRTLSCLLLGSSLAAIPWKLQEFSCSLGIILIGFSIRWLLYALESWDLRMADLRKQPLPCLATRIRRGITLITGALIPLMILAGLPTVPLLATSFILTAFSQWTAACEACHAHLAQIPLMAIPLEDERHSSIG